MPPEPSKINEPVSPILEIRHESQAAKRRSGSSLRWLLSLLGAASLIIVCWLHWGGYLLIAHDRLPAHAEAAVVLQGSIEGQKVRIAAAADLLQRGMVQRILLSVPAQSYWGQSVPPVARQYLEREYGSAIASRADFCETGGDVDSTAQEAQVLITCIQQRGWKQIVVVTSNYHTRRAGMIWRRAVRRSLPAAQLYVYGAADADFQPQDWWLHRRFAKTWFMESVKLMTQTLGN